jgi:serine phosphatase RsbU (regulator of sigma subunit)
MLADLRDRLRSQGTIPDLPEGWEFESAFVSAHGGGYGGDFLVTQLRADAHQLELILVDVAGKGVPAATRALQFGGALGGLIGALPPQGVVAAANTFLFRQDSDETFATAVHVVVDLITGEYHLTNAGHPPVLVWSGTGLRWVPDDVRGTALGVVPQPEIRTSTGVLEPGQALLLYTDGVVETRTADLDRGVVWLQHEAQEAVHGGFGGAARRILDSVESEDDDRAVIVVRRLPVGVVEPEPAVGVQQQG